MIGPGLVEVLAQVSKEPHTIAICAGIALLFHFTIRLLSISAPLVPPANEVSFVWLKYWLASRRNRGPFWGLLQTHILIDALPTHPYLPRNGGDIDLFGREVMDLLVACDTLLVELKAFCFQMLPHAGLPGSKLLRLLLREVLGWLLNQGFELRLKVRERSLSWFLRGSKASATGQQFAELVVLLAWHHLQTRLRDPG